MNTPVTPVLSRRSVVKSALTIAGMATLSAPLTWMTAESASAATLQNWSNPATWGGVLPKAGDVVTISKDIRLDINVNVAGIVIKPGARLVFHPRKSLTLTTTGNVVVDGVLQMCPSAADKQHVILFNNIDESRFAGGGMEVVGTDTGLWVRNAGLLNIKGTPKTAWVRSATSIPLGATTIALAADALGWRVGDELVVTPTASPEQTNHFEQFDEARIVALSGRIVTLDRPLTYAHEILEIGDGNTLAPQILNLTRNVRIEGTETGRTHTWVSTTGLPSTVRYAQLRHFGPRKANGSTTDPVLGRYGLHLHMAADASRGTQFEGLVARDGGSHAFVTHMSHGVTLTSCIAYNTAESAFWYDGAPDTRTLPSMTNDLSYESCVAARTLSVPAYRGFTLAGFELGFGYGNKIRNCTAVGVQGNKDASGFLWPEGADSGVWDFADCVTHNNKVHGVFTWQNSEHLHRVTRLISANNGHSGISHGAYLNSYVYSDIILFRNLVTGITLHAASRGENTMTFENILIDGAGIARNALVATHHQLTDGSPTIVRRCTAVHHSDAAILVAESSGRATPSLPTLLDVESCDFGPLDVRFEDAGLNPESTVRIQLDDATQAVVRPLSYGEGEIDTRRNAKVMRTTRLQKTSARTPLSLLTTTIAPVS